MYVSHFHSFFKKNTTVHFSQTSQPALIQKQLTSFLDGLEDTCYYNGSGRSIANYYFRSQVDKFRSFTFDIFIFIVRHKKKRIYQKMEAYSGVRAASENKPLPGSEGHVSTSSNRMDGARRSFVKGFLAIAG